MSEKSRRSPGAVAVYGAAGHTARFVVAELLRGGLTPVAVGRDAEKLASCGFAERGIEVRVAALVDASALCSALAGTGAVINCAGPFLDTAQPLIRAALDAGVHYVDVCAEQASALATFAEFDAAARERELAVIPAAGFYGGLGDLLATATMRDWTSVDEITLAIALDSWKPTQGTRRTGKRNTATRLVVASGALRPQSKPAEMRTWSFEAPFDMQEVVEVPFTETILLARHVRAASIRNYLTTHPLRELSDPSTPAPEPADASGRSAQIFQMEAVVRRGDETRRASLRGRDIYAFTAPLVVEAAKQLVTGACRRSGALALGEAFDAAHFLEAIASETPPVLSTRR